MLLCKKDEESKRRNKTNKVYGSEQSAEDLAAELRHHVCDLMAVKETGANV